MTHSRSIAARAKRTDRALTLGYVRNRPLDRVHIAVPAALASSVKVVAKSIQLHAAHDSIAGRPHHHARLATLSISDQLCDQDFRTALRTHRAAGRAKHNVGALAISSSFGMHGT